MRRLLFLGFCLVASTAQASVVSGSFVGRVVNANADAATLFHLSGSADGATLTGSFSYDTANFSAPSLTCQINCRAWGSTDGSMLNGTVTIAETVNGVTLIWSGVYYSGLLLANSPAGGSWPYAYWTQAFELLSENNTASGANAAQVNFGMLTNSATMVSAALDPTGPFDFSVKQIESNGSNWGTAQWGFVTIGVPEPEPLTPMALALAGLFGLRSISRKRPA